MSRKNTPSAHIQVERLLNITQAVAQSVDWKLTLGQISALMNPYCRHDGIVTYFFDTQRQEYLEFSLQPENIGSEGSPDGLTSLALTLIDNPVADVDPKISLITIQEPSLIHIAGARINLKHSQAGALLIYRRDEPPFSQLESDLLAFVFKQITMLIDQQALENRYNQLEVEFQKFIPAEDFISTIAHEIRGPLGFIKGYTSTLLRSDTSWTDREQREFLQIIDRETDHLQELLDTLLDSSQIQTGRIQLQFEPIDLLRLVSDIVERTRTHHPLVQISIIDDRQEIHSIHCDPHRLTRVFENLIINAIKYAPGSKILVTIVQDENDSRISVEDFGPGVSEKYLPYLFERFYRVPESANSVHGSGLGLFICKQIVQAHDGEINVTSRVGKGSVFQVILPNKPPDQPNRME